MRRTNTKHLFLITSLAALVSHRAVAAEGQVNPDCAIGGMPEGYHLQAYDDCGVLERQPHVRQKALHTFSTSEVNADERARTVSHDPRQVDVAYEGLDPKLEYVVAVTYANEPYNHRTQSLWAGPIQLHGPRVLPKGKAERLLFKVPRAAMQDGKLDLHFRLEGQVNAVVSAVELWAPKPSPNVLRIEDVCGLYTDLEGRVLGLSYEGVGGATVTLSRMVSGERIASVSTEKDGNFRFPRSSFDKRLADVRLGDLEIVAEFQRQNASKIIPAADLTFKPVRYRPIPAKVKGVHWNQLSLDGAWRIHTAPTPEVRNQPLDTKGWNDIQVPGQWLQQGYDIPQDKTVAMAREFTIPSDWAGHRIILRFDAIHAGTTYWVNGKRLGYSENLFTPVEWDITDAATAGRPNRLYLEMKVDTVSERLSYSSGYAFHSLGGIDRSVRLYALPMIHVQDLHIATDLDKEYEDADLKLRLTLDIPCKVAQGELALDLRLFDPDGKLMHTPPATPPLGPFGPGRLTLSIKYVVANTLKWSAERPYLSRLCLELKRGGDILERIERKIGFRKIEVRDGQLYINGVRVKLAGACHHEIDPLTGRADTARHAKKDIELLKGANLNYIRTSHYPPTQELLDAADELGMYVEVEAPFCWVAPDASLTHLKEVLTPTSAMIDYNHVHPSVILWSLANESNFNRFFELSNKLCKELDPTRPTTFNNPDPKRVCDIANVHYPPMPYDQQLKDDPRPILLGEYFFPVCHEQTDVRIDPGLRELWGHGHSDPESAWGKFCAASFDPSVVRPGIPPGAWSHIVQSKRVIGAAIWAGLDEPFYLPGGKHVGYAWHHGFWGLIDAWRRPKPEWWLSKMIFSPVWFPVRQVGFTEGQTTVRVPVENRYSFTNLSDLLITCELSVRPAVLGAKDLEPSPGRDRLGGHETQIRAHVPPGTKGELEMPVPKGAKAGDTLMIRVGGLGFGLATPTAIRLGPEPPRSVPQPKAGAPTVTNEGDLAVIDSAGYRLVFDRSKAVLKPDDPRHTAPIIEFPCLHVTRYDFGDLAGPSSPPYAVFPDAGTRRIEGVTINQLSEGLEITVRDRYEGFAGQVRWLIDRFGMSKVTCEYQHTGETLNAREVGMRMLLKKQCDELGWKRWSEWGVFPDDSISRTEGTAKARRDAKWPDVPEGTRPSWPWYWDQTELGTNDFRSIKFNIYEASLAAPDGSGVRVHANADAHVRACLDPEGVRMHVLSQCRLAPVVIKKSDAIRGAYVLELLRASEGR
jgi:beta-galactosidase